MVFSRMLKVLLIMCFLRAFLCEAVPNRAYIANYSNTVTVMDTKTREIVDVISDSNFSQTYQIAISPDGNFIYVADYANSTVSVINAKNNQLVDETYYVIGGPSCITLTPNGRLAYVPSSNTNYLNIINFAEYSVTSFNGYNGSNNVAITPDGLLAYITNTASPIINVIRVPSSEEVAQITTGGAPFATAISKTSTYVLNQVFEVGKPDFVSIINTTTQKGTERFQL